MISWHNPEVLWWLYIDSYLFTFYLVFSNNQFLELNPYTESDSMTWSILLLKYNTHNQAQNQISDNNRFPFTGYHHYNYFMVINMTLACLSKSMKCPVTLCYHIAKTKPRFTQNGKDQWLQVVTKQVVSNIMISRRKHMIMILVKTSEWHRIQKKNFVIVKCNSEHRWCNNKKPLIIPKYTNMPR